MSASRRSSSASSAAQTVKVRTGQAPQGVESAKELFSRTLPMSNGGMAIPPAVCFSFSILVINWIFRKIATCVHLTERFHVIFRHPGATVLPRRHAEVVLRRRHRTGCGAPRRPGRQTD